jgi:hypothetical protein
MTACGSLASKSTGRAPSGSKPLFEVNHSASFQGALRPPKASITSCTALIGFLSSNWKAE